MYTVKLKWDHRMEQIWKYFKKSGASELFAQMGRETQKEVEKKKLKRIQRKEEKSKEDAASYLSLEGTEFGSLETNPDLVDFIRENKGSVRQLLDGIEELKDSTKVGKTDSTDQA